jgi:N-acetylmuramoyl-L-alanine amidase
MLNIFSKPWLLLFFIVTLYLTFSLPVTTAHTLNNNKFNSLTEKSAVAVAPAAPKQIVTIDPGHGGTDRGAIGLNNLSEVDVDLPIALQVAQILRQKGVVVNLTRSNDSFVSLEDRIKVADKNKSNIFVSIHANAMLDTSDVNGLETYYHSSGAKLAKIVHGTVIEKLGGNNPEPLGDRSIKEAKFLVLRQAKIPAILVEVGYLTSPTESVRLANKEYQDKMADAIAQGISRYLGKEITKPGVPS